MGRIITLLTDFGLKDPYVSIMKGVILSRNNNAVIVDAGHEISPQNIKEGGLFLADSITYYPRGSIHVVVIDPGVGSERKIIVLNIRDRIVITPDNGVVSEAVKRFSIKESYEIEIKDKYFQISNTFHGRDIFAPAAAEISLFPLEKLQYLKKIDKNDIVIKDLFNDPVYEKGILKGDVYKIDNFGNIISTIKKKDAEHYFKDISTLGVKLEDFKIKKIRKSYSFTGDGEVTAIWNSDDRLEIACVNQNAYKKYFDGKKIDIHLCKL